MNSDQLLRNLDDCAKASTHEPDAETINAAIAEIKRLREQLENAQKLADVLLDERNEEVKKVAYWSKAYDDAKRDAWNAAIDCVAAVIENVPYENQNAVAVAKQSAEVARTFKK